MHRDQTRALFGIVIFGAAMLAAILLFVFNNPAEIQQNRAVELTYVILIVAAALAYGVVLVLTARRNEGEALIADERDVEIARRALYAQLVAVLATITLWCVALGLIYMDRHLVPLALVYMMVNSVFFVNMLARSIAIYRGYLVPLLH